MPWQVNCLRIRHTYHLEHEAATQAWAKRLAKGLRAGDVLALSGDLGAGKSVLARALMRALKVEDEALPSPTYALIQEYQGMTCGGEPCFIAHMDLYRLDDVAEVEMLGIRDFFAPPWICLIEWAERAGSVLPDTLIRLDLSYVEGRQNERYITLSACQSLHDTVALRD